MSVVVEKTKEENFSEYQKVLGFWESKNEMNQFIFKKT